MRITEHSKDLLFRDCDVLVNGVRLGPAAFESQRYYEHYVEIIKRLAKLEDIYCKERSSNADRIRAMTDEELAMFFTPVRFRGCPPGSKWPKSCEEGPGCGNCWLDWLKQEADNA